MDVGTSESACQSVPVVPGFLDAYRPDESGCLILDVRMPEMGGTDLQQALQDRHIRLPIIFMTAYGDVTTCGSAFRRGSDHFWRNLSTTSCCWIAFFGSLRTRRCIVITS